MGREEKKGRSGNRFLLRGRSSFLLGLAAVLILPISVIADIGRITLHSNTYTIDTNPDGTVLLRMEGFGFTSRPGHPRLPLKTFCIVLPARTRVTDVHIEPAQSIDLDMQPNVEAAKPWFPSDGDQTWDKAGFFRTRDSVYAADRFYPENPASEPAIDAAGNAPVVKIRFTPFLYNPVRRSLRFIPELSVSIGYETAASEEGKSGPGWSPILLRADTVLPDPILGIDGFSFPTLTRQTVLQVIAPQALEHAVEPFLFWKTCQGHTVEYTTTEAIDVSFPGSDRTEKIRNFLIQKTAESGIRHVLLIGHVDAIPVKKLYPDPGNHEESGAIPSDCYFAELSGSWDRDGDGFAGEYGDDHIDIFPEVVVGRIPFSDTTTVRSILEKIVTHEKDMGSWKQDALLMGAISNYTNENNSGASFIQTDGASLMEYLKNGVFQNRTVHTLYEKEGLEPSPFSCDESLSDLTATAAWTSGSYGCLTWWAHGNYRSASRKCWPSDDGDNVPESSEIDWQRFITVDGVPVNPDRQPVAFANACDNGWPEKISLGREMIRQSCAAVVSSSRATWYVLGWNHVDDGGNATMDYYFWDQFIGKSKRAGEALSLAKVEYMAKFDDAWQNLHNMYAFNFFGDPTLAAFEDPPSFGGCSGRVVRSDGTPVAGAHVMISSLGKEAPTDSKGRFTLYSIPGGSYMLRVEADDLAGKSVPVSVTNGEKTVVDVSLSSSPIPRIAFPALTVESECEEGAETTAYFRVSNSGSAPAAVRFEQAPDEPEWIAADHSEHRIEPGATDSLQLVFRSGSMDMGNAAGVLELTSNDPDRGRVPVSVTMTVLDRMPPGTIADLGVVRSSADTVFLRWTAPGDNGDQGHADNYELWLSTSGVDIPGPSNASRLAVWTCSSPGSGETKSLTIPFDENTRWLTVKTLDEAGWHSFSNTVSLIHRPTAVPAVALSDTSISEICQEGNTTIRNLGVSNIGTGVLTFRMELPASDMEWLSADTSQHRVDPGSVEWVPLHFVPGNRDAGRIETRIKLLTNVPDSQERTLLVVLTLIDTIPPSSIRDLVASDTNADSLVLTWTAPGDNGIQGTAEQTRIWMSNRPEAESLGQNAVLVCEFFPPEPPGSRETRTVPIPLGPGPFWYIVEILDEAGHGSLSNPVQVIATGQSSPDQNLSVEKVEQNWPNPFNGQTEIRFSLLRSGPLSLRIFNSRGQTVHLLQERQYAEGSHTLSWAALDENGTPLPSGLYFYEVTIDRQRTTKRMLLVR